MPQMIQCPACEQNIPATSIRCPNCNDNTKFHIEVSGGIDKVIHDQKARRAPTKHKKLWIIAGITLWLLCLGIIARGLLQ
jgi:hypothetical protein